MRTFILLATVMAIATGTARADSIDKAKLRMLARMPYAYFPERGERFGGDNLWRPSTWVLGPRTTLADGIVKIEQALKDHPDDADKHYHLGLLRHDEGKLVEASRSFDRAAELYRKRLETKPDDGRTLAGLGLALKGRKAKLEEAEALLRRAVKVAPQDSECWLALHAYLYYKTSLIYFEGVTSKVPLQAAFGERPGKLPRADAELMGRLFAEADDCLDKAVACAPRDPKAYSVRGSYYDFDRYALQCELAVANGKNTNLDEASAAELTARQMAAWADFHKAAELSSQDPNTVGRAVISAHMLRPRTVYSQKATFKPLLEAIAAKDRKLLEADLAELKKLTASAERSIGAAAWSYLAYAQLAEFQQPKEAEASIREALRLDPQLDTGWAILQVILRKEKRTQDLLTMYKERIKYRDNAPNRFELATAHADLKQFDRAEEEVRLALRHEPANARILLGLAALLLRRSENEAALKEAGTCLDRAQEKLKNVELEWKRPSWDAASGLLPVDFTTTREDPEASLRQVDYNLLRGIHLALTGNITEARVFLSALGNEKDQLYSMPLDPSDEQARKSALKALGK